MDSPNEKCESSNRELEGDDVKNIDLTLKLGPSLLYNQNQDEDNNTTTTATVTCRGSQGYFGTASQSSNDIMGNWNVEYNSSSSGAAKEGRSSSSNYNHNYMLYPHFPHNHVSTPNPIPIRKRPNLDDTKACKACGSNSTPLWRKGPDGPQTLCNACGLRHLRTVKRGGE